MDNDIELLRRYAETGSEEAFSELVRRHIDFVYATAVRQANGAHRAEDVAQAVFTDLARKARTLCGRTELAGWLYISTRYAALAVVRSEARRAAREKEAQMIHEFTSENGSQLDWATLRPMLDEALHDLGEADRAAILRRFFCNDSLVDIAQTLGVSEDAARKRVNRALDKLHALLARRGVTSTAAALTVAFAHQPVLAAPAGLAAAVAGGALSGASAVGAGAATTGGVISFMSTSKIYVGVAAVVTALVVGLAWSEYRQPETIETKETAVRSDVERVIRERAAPLVKSALATVTTVSPTVEQQRKAMESNLRQIAAARTQFTLENGRWPTRLSDLVGPGRFIKELRAVGGEDYSAVSLKGGQLMRVVSANGLVAEYDPGAEPAPGVNSDGSRGGGRAASLSPGEEMMRRSSDILNRLDPAIRRKAMNAYQAAHDGKRPTRDPRAIVGYFDSAKDGADYLEYVELWEAAQRMLEKERTANGK